MSCRHPLTPPRAVSARNARFLCLPAGFTYTSSTVVTDHIDRLILVDLDYALQAAMVPIRGFSDRPGLPMVVADVFYLGAARATPRDDF